MNSITNTGTKITVEEILQNPQDVNSAIEYFCQVNSNRDTRTRVLLRLLAQIGRSSAFDFLRTKLGLGYVVKASIRETVNTEGYQPLWNAR